MTKVTDSPAQSIVDAFNAVPEQIRTAMAKEIRNKAGFLGELGQALSLPSSAWNLAIRNALRDAKQSGEAKRLATGLSTDGVWGVVSASLVAEG